MDYRLDAVDNGRRFNDMWEDEVRWVDDAKCWFVCRGGRWLQSEEDVREMGKLVVSDMYQEGLQALAAAELLPPGPAQDAAMGAARAVLNWAKRTADGFFDKMLRMAQSESRIRIHMADFDKDPWILNTPSGVWDLRTLRQIQDYDVPNLLLTKMAGASPCSWKGGLWEKFLEYVLPDVEVRRFMQLACGYAAFFGVEERLIMFLLGGTGHGKSKFVEAIHAALGDYAVSVPTDQFLVGAKDNYSLARLPGARWISASEFDEHAKVNVALVKRITSGEPVTVRMAYGKPFDYSPGGTIVVSTNHAPFLGGDEAAWARSVFVPFNTPLGLEARTLFGDRDLSVQLREAAGEVLGWIMEGARDYWAAPSEGGMKLQRPGAVVQATEDVKLDQRHYVVQCVEQMFDGDPDVLQVSGDVYEVLRWWCEREGIQERDLVRQDWMGRRLKQSGAGDVRTKSARYWAIGRLRGDAIHTAVFYNMEARDRMLRGFTKLGGGPVTPNEK